MSYPAYPEYKDSNEGFLGKVPSTWSISPLKHTCTILPSNVDKHTDPGEAAVRLCNYTDVYYQDRIAESLELMNASASRDQIEKFTLQAQDVVITKDSESADDIAIPSFVPKSLPNVVCGYHLAIIRPNQAVDGLFLNYLLMAKPLRAYFEISARGLTRVGLSQFALGRAEVAWPPKEEQTQIACFLDHQTARIGALIAEQQRLIELLKEKRQAVISHAVTKGLDPDVAMKDSGVEWLGNVPAHWSVTRLKFVSRIVDCKNRTPEFFDDGEYLVVRTSNVKNQVLNTNGAYYTNEDNFRTWTLRGVPPKGSILFTREAPAGEVCLVPEDVPLCLGQRMMNIIPNDSRHTSFIFDFLTSDCLTRYIESVSHGSTVSHLRVEQVYDIPLLIPPLNEQKAIDEKVSVLKTHFRSLIDEAEKNIKLLNERRSALISAAVTGKIDLRDWQPPSSETLPEASVSEGAIA